jgi:hypothetical protein
LIVMPNSIPPKHGSFLADSARARVRFFEAFLQAGR